MIPLSYAQRRLWFLNRLEGASSTYNAPVVVRLSGVPDVAALELALADVLERHEVLRTVLPTEGGEPFQQVLDKVDGLLSVVECDADTVDGLVAEFCRAEFDLLTDVPVRVKLFVPGDESVLVLLLHHVATDGWSLGPLLRDLSDAFAARSAGRAPHWEPLPVQYADYTLWQRDMLGEADDPGSEISEQLDYWRAALTGAPERLALPADRPYPAEPSGRGGLVVGRIDAEVHRRLQEAARTRRASLFMVFQAALALALSLVTATEDVPIGTAVAGRSAEEALDDLVGFFVNTLVLRTDVSGDPSFTELVDRVREADLGAFAHQDLPFDLLVEHLNPVRSLAHHPFFQVMLTVDTDLQTELRLGELTGRIEPVDLRAAKFDLTVFCAETSDGVEVWWQYAMDLFDEPTARLLLDVFVRVLEAVAADPSVRVGNLAVLSEEERSGLADRRERLVETQEPEQPVTAASVLTPRQEILAGLFAEALGLPFVAGQENFFRIGGHSLLGVRLVNRVRSVLGVEVGIRDLFLAPTVVGLDARVGELVDGTRPALEPVVRPGPVPLSYAQRRLWFVHELEGASRSYNIPVIVRLEHLVDPVVLELALADVVRRHEVLRSVFSVVDGEPFQIVLQDVRPSVDVIQVREEETASAVDALAAHIFDVGSEIPVRASLVQVEDDVQILVVVVHHVAGDGWSVGRLLADLGQAYAARSEGGAPGWEPLPVQYGDYAVWQRELLGEASDPGSLVTRQLEYWREALAGAPPVLELPSDRARPGVASHRGGIVVFGIVAEVHRGLTRVAAECGATLFMVVQAAFATVLSRMGGGTDLPIGTVVAGRDDEALHDLVGFFVNTLVLRTDVSGDPTFAELVGRVRESDLAAYAHQDVPFDLLVEHLNPVRSASYHPLVQVMLTLQTDFQPDSAGSPLAGDEVPVDSGVAKFDLTVAVRERRDAAGAPDGLTGVVECAADVFDHGEADLIAGLLTGILTAVAGDPHQRVADLELPAGPQAPPAPSVPDATITELFEARAAGGPDAIAVVQGRRQLSYGELNAGANRLAHHLLRNGIGRGAMVAVLLERDIPLAVAVVAVLKCGAAYVLLDPESGETAPSEVSAVISEAGLAHRLGGTPVFLLDGDGSTMGNCPSHDPSLERNPGDAACMMLAEGPAGEPQAVLSSHRAVLGTVLGRSLADEPGVWLQCAPLAWSAFAVEFWGALLSGGTCVLPEGTRPGPDRIAAEIKEHGVTSLFLPSRLFAHLVDTHPTALAGLRQVTVGGEPPSSEHLVRARRLFGHVRIGYARGPVDGGRCYVLDSRLRRVPVGVPGELYVAGSVLADGYPGRPGASAASFVADPFGADGERMIRTGDLVRWTEQGTLRHLGPIEGPPVIQGARVLLGEIEQVLTRHETVSRAAVVVRGDRLVAYVVPHEGAAVDAAALRAATGEALAEHMVPSAVVILEDLPLTQNGDLDRDALPAPEEPGKERGPNGPLEEALSGLFAELLDGRQVGVDANFFKVGGHSLLAVRLVNRIRSALGMDITLRDVFQAPSVAALAVRLQASGGAVAAQEENKPVLRRRTRGGSRLREEPQVARL